MAPEEQKFWVGITTLATFGGSGLYVVFDHPFWGTVFIVIGLMGLAYAIREHFKKATVSIPILLFLISLTWVLLGYDIYDRHFSGVVPAFRKTYQQYRNILGRPMEQLATKGVYQAWHERAVVIWVMADEAFYVARTVDSEKDSSWKLIADAHFEDERQQENWKLYDDSRLRTMFRPLGLPDDKYPPWAGVASHWLRQPGYWKDLIGWRRSHCGLEPKLIFFQRFEKGTIVGPLRRNATVDNQGEIFVFFNGGGWRSVATQDQKITPCSVPWSSPGGTATIE
jgi:hypothetical protein